MDVAQINDIAGAVWNYGQYLPVIGGCAAGVAMIALFSGMSRLKRSSRPARFPADPEASQPKYALAFNQLSDFADGGLGGSNKVTASSTLPAQSLCASAFSLFCSTPEVPPPPSKISKKIDKKQ